MEKIEEDIQLTDAVEAPLNIACKLTSLLLINQVGDQMETNTFKDNSGVLCLVVK